CERREPGESGDVIQIEWRRHLRRYYSATVSLSGAHPPWKVNGTRTGRRIVATGSPAKSWASRMTMSLRSRSGSETEDMVQPSSSAAAPGFRTKTGSDVIRPGP